MLSCPERESIGVPLFSVLLPVADDRKAGPVREEHTPLRYEFRGSSVEGIGNASLLGAVRSNEVSVKTLENDGRLAIRH